MASIPVTPRLSIEEHELVFSFARSSGPGGQNVNKVESAVHLRFDVSASPSLNSWQKRRLAALAGSRMSADGVLIIFAQAHRSQDRNKAEAVERLVAMIAASAEPPVFRVKTRPTLASKRRRTEAKVRRGALKRSRGKPTGD